MRIEQDILDFVRGETVTIERTTFVDKLIAGRHVTVVEVS